MLYIGSIYIVELKIIMSHIILRSTQHAATAALLVLSLAIASFFMFEPTIGRGQATDNFTVSQTITDEISFLVTADDVTMNGSIQGLTGGYATGTTMVVVRSNEASGYNMTLHFATTSSGRAMQASSTAYINDYTPASNGVPDFTWVDNASGQASEFGYTVSASTSGQVSQLFMNDGSDCNTGSTESADRCWLNPTTTPVSIVSSSAPVSGSTTTIKFKVAVPNNPSPSLPSGTYVATGILTATNNP